MDPKDSTDVTAVSKVSASSTDGASTSQEAVTLVNCTATLLDHPALSPSSAHNNQYCNAPDASTAPSSTAALSEALGVHNHLVEGPEASEEDTEELENEEDLNFDVGAVYNYDDGVIRYLLQDRFGARRATAEEWRCRGYF